MKLLTYSRSTFVTVALHQVIEALSAQRGLLFALVKGVDGGIEFKPVPAGHPVDVLGRWPSPVVDTVQEFRFGQIDVSGRAIGIHHARGISEGVLEFFHLLPRRRFRQSFEKMTINNHLNDKRTGSKQIAVR